MLYDSPIIMFYLPNPDKPEPKMVVKIKRLFNDAEACAGHRAKRLETLCPMLYSASINNFLPLNTIKYLLRD